MKYIAGYFDAFLHSMMMLYDVRTLSNHEGA